VRSRAVGPERVELLWDICRIPDYRKLLFESHVALLAELFAQLTGARGKLDADWVGARIAELDDPSGDLDTLVDRIAAVRTYTYVANQAHFLDDPETFQARTRAIEDRLSDALHERIVQRFVERRGPRRAPLVHPPNAPRPRPSEPGRPEPPPSRPSHPFAVLASLYESLSPTPAPPGRGDEGSFAANLVAAPHSEFSLRDGGRISYQGEPVGVLSRGGTLLLPEVRVTAWDGLGAGARSQMHRRLVAFARDLVAELLAPLRDERVQVLSAAARGLLYQLERGLGTALRDDDAATRTPLTGDDERILGALGVRLGARVLDVPALREAAPRSLRFALVRAYFEAAAPPLLPPEDAPTCPVAPHTEPLSYAALGYPVFGPRGVRADLVERVHDALETGAATPRSLAALLRCELRDVEAIATRIGAAGADRV
jgi:ATP-dependent RNA helicase SUPV3L1/SUV3